jgi:ADP-heptose:LPS heptosyltransferase
MLRVFIHHDGALGDVLLSLPCFSVLRSEVDVLHLAARPDVGCLLKETGWVDEAFSSDSGLFAPLYSGGVDERARTFLGRFDRVFLFTADPGSTLAAVCRKVVSATMTVLTIPPADEQMHSAVFRFLQFGKGAPFPEGPFLQPPRRSSDLAAALLTRSGYDGTGPLIAVHPGSGGRSKCWPLERYETLICRMQRELTFRCPHRACGS